MSTNDKAGSGMSTPAKHTPGPWLPIRLDIGSRSFWIAINADGKLPETEANARLIGAAPTMFEAGSALIREFDNIYDVDDGQANIPGDLMALVDKLRAALALAPLSSKGKDVR